MVLLLCQQGTPALQAPSWEQDMPRLGAAIRAAEQRLANVEPLVMAATQTARARRP